MTLMDSRLRGRGGPFYINLLDMDSTLEMLNACDDARTIKMTM